MARRFLIWYLFSVALSESMCIFAFCPSLNSCNSFTMSRIHSAFLLCSFVHILFYFLMIRLLVCLRAFSPYLLVEFFIVFECPRMFRIDNIVLSCLYIFLVFLVSQILSDIFPWEFNYHDQKITMTRKRRTPTHDIRKNWTAVSTLLGLICSVYRNPHHWRPRQRPKLCISHTSDAKLVMVIALLINLNVSCKLHPYSSQRTRLPPGPRLPKGIRNTHLFNYYNLKGKEICTFFFFF